jgi:hypothetical protein
MHVQKDKIKKFNGALNVRINMHITTIAAAAAVSACGAAASARPFTLLSAQNR